MTELGKRLKVDSIDIETPSGLPELITQVFGSTNESYLFRLANISAPLFIYKEELIRNEHGLIGRESRIEYHIANERGVGVMHLGVDRNFLRLSGHSISESERGNILVAFSHIEFILNAMLFYIEGIYEDKCEYRQFYEDMMQKSGSAFHTFENKKKYLYLKKVVANETFRSLTKVQKIRNHIAHQFFLDSSLGLKLDDIKAYRSAGEAVEAIFNHCMLLLLRDYNPYQLKILESIIKP